MFLFSFLYAQIGFVLQYYLFPAQVTYNVHFFTSRYLKNINQNEDISSDISIVFLGVLSLLWYVNISMQLPKIEKKKLHKNYNA